MRLSVCVNGASVVVASLSGPGYLSAHLNIEDRPKENGQSKNVRVVGIATGETETVHYRWPPYDLKTGDVVELRILPEGKGDAPGSVQTSSQPALSLLSNANLAKELLQIVSDFESRLMQLQTKSGNTEPAEEHKKFTGAIGAVLVELGNRLLYPVYRRHKGLVPDELKGELL